MELNNGLRKFTRFFLVRILIGSFALIATVAFTDLVIFSILKILRVGSAATSLIINLVDSMAALVVCFQVFKALEKRKITELSRDNFFGLASFGFLLGLILQSFFIFVIYLAGGYKIIDINPFYFILHSLSTALMAGFVAELLIRGIFFRILEEKLGTLISLLIAIVVFAFAHAGKEGAGILSIAATTSEAGFMLSAAFIYSRSLWLPIFLHIAWDFVEPGIFGAINPGNSIKESWFTSEFTGSSIITGGRLGPQNSIQSLLLCTITGILFLWLAHRKNRLIKPFWRNGG